MYRSTCVMAVLKLLDLERKETGVMRSNKGALCIDNYLQNPYLTSVVSCAI